MKKVDGIANLFDLAVCFCTVGTFIGLQRFQQIFFVQDWKMNERLSSAFCGLGAKVLGKE